MRFEKAIYLARDDTFPAVTILPESYFSETDCHFKFGRRMRQFNFTTKGVWKLGFWSFKKKKKSTFSLQINKFFKVDKLT